MAPEIWASHGPARLKAPLLWTALFAGLSLLRVLFHEMWRDEMNIWVAVADSSSFSDLAHSLRYGGHGLLWPSSVYLLAKLVPHPLAMQCLHVAIATASAWFLFRFSPFSKWETLLLGFGYYLFFEYTLIARHYAWEILCLMTILVCLTCRQPKFTLAVIGLILLTQTTVYGLILSVALTVSGCFIFKEAAQVRNMRSRDYALLCFAMAMLFASMVSAIDWMQPPADSGFQAQWHWGLDSRRLVNTFATLWRAFLPVPTPGLHFWNSNILDNIPWLAGLLGLAIAALALQRLRRCPQALICWASATGALLLFTYVKYLGYQRHHGHLFLAFLAGLWLMAADRRRDSATVGRIPPATGLSCVWIKAVLVTQLLVGLYASGMDAAHPFSASRAAASYIRENHLDQHLIVADFDYAAVPVVGRLDAPHVYYPRGEWSQRLIIWDKKRKRKLPPQEFLKAVKSVGEHTSRPVLAMTSYALSDVPAYLEPVAHFEAGIVPDEGYHLFHVSLKTTAH